MPEIVDGHFCIFFVPLSSMSEDKSNSAYGLARFLRRITPHNSSGLGGRSASMVNPGSLHVFTSIPRQNTSRQALTPCLHPSEGYQHSSLSWESPGKCVFFQWIESPSSHQSKQNASKIQTHATTNTPRHAFPSHRSMATTTHLGQLFISFSG